ncbi:type A2 lantipeptide [Streptomyces sp. NPDC001922]|uniref:type A2 lantipeptide n=1 Tax=Streptomyces sp. NPDC001922 TaxID=3364624 RepID=UPI0036BC62C7
MRKDAMPQIETREILDSELDNVSGGILGTEIVTGGAESALPGLPPLGGSLSGGLSGQAGPVSAEAGFSGGAGI